MKIKIKIIIIAVAAVLLAAVFLLFGSCGPRESRSYTCPMHPQVVQDRPGSCPICGMDLVPLDKHAGHESGGENGEAAADRVKVFISPYKQQLINIRLKKAEYRSLEKITEAPGIVAYDPELYSAQLDFISAFRGGAVAGSMKESAAQKLKSLGLSGADIRALEKAEEADKSLINADSSGSVTVYARIYQEDIAGVKSGAKAAVTAATSGGEVFYGRVTAVDRILSAETRSSRARIRVENSAGKLLPEMYVNVKIISDEGVYLCVPEEAVIKAGGRDIVFVKNDDSHFEPRVIAAGGKMSGYYAVKSGVKDGEEVVVNGNFLVDSESRLKAAAANMGTHAH